MQHFDYETQRARTLLREFISYLGAHPAPHDRRHAVRASGARRAVVPNDADSDALEVLMHVAADEASVVTVGAAVRGRQLRRSNVDFRQLMFESSDEGTLEC